MKKSVLVLGVLAAAAGSVFAQSTVQLYGIVDAGVRYTTNSGANGKGSLTQVVPGGMSNSRLGINVAEDMGGGLKAMANLEHRLNSDNGAQTAGEFWRQAWVGLDSKEFGRVTVGRQYNVLFDLYTTTYPSFKYSPYIETFRPETAMAMSGRQSNMVKYRNESGGFVGELQVSLGEGTSHDKGLGGMLRYAEGEWAFGGGYLQVTDTGGKKVKGMTAGVGYTSGPLYVNVSFGQNKFDAGSALMAGYTGAGSISVTPGGTLNAAGLDVKKRDMMAVGFTYQYTKELNLGVQGWYAKQSHHKLTGESKAGFMAFVADYAFSKRTDVYGIVDYSKLGGAVAFANTAKTRIGLSTGIRHRF